MGLRMTLASADLLPSWCTAASCSSLSNNRAGIGLQKHHGGFSEKVQDQIVLYFMQNDLKQLILMIICYNDSDHQNNKLQFLLDCFYIKLSSSHINFTNSLPWGQIWLYRLNQRHQGKLAQLQLAAAETRWNNEIGKYRFSFGQSSKSTFPRLNKFLLFEIVYSNLLSQTEEQRNYLHLDHFKLSNF